MQNRTFTIRIVSILIIGVLMGLSIWFGSAFASTESFHHEDIEYLEGKKNNAKALSASASGVSVLVSLLPEDTATPLANQIADVGRDFMIVLGALAAEQSLLTITGRITFCWIIPIALGIMILFVLFKRKMYMQVGVKLALAGCIIYMLLPVTLRIIRLADGAYDEAVDTSLQQSQEIEEAFNYNENGVVMPGMDGGTAGTESEEPPASEPQSETGAVLQTEEKSLASFDLQSEDLSAALSGSQSETQSTDQSSLQTEDHNPARAASQTGTQSEALSGSQTEAGSDAPVEERIQALTEQQVKKQTKKTAKKLPWYKRLWNTITGAGSDEAQTEARTAAGNAAKERIQALTEQQVKKKTKKAAKKLPWYERLWNTITGAESVEAGAVIQTETGMEAQTEPLTEAIAQTQTEPVVGAIAQTQTEPVIEAIVQTQTEPVTEAIVQTPKPDQKRPWYERVRDSLAKAASGAADRASQLRGRIADTATSAADKIQETASEAVSKAKAAGEKASEMAALALEVPQMAANLLDSLIDAFVLMIVTTCVLPIVVLIGLFWIVNQLLNIHLDWEKMTL